MSESRTISFVIELLKQLPLKPAARIQGGIIRLPTRVQVEDDPDGRPYRPWATIWLNISQHTVNKPAMDRPGRLDHADALKALVRFCNDPQLCGFRPGRLEVGDPALRDYLAQQLEGTEIRVVRLDRLPELTNFLHLMATRLNEGAPEIPGLLSGKGVTVEAVRAFADAAAEFHRAALWQHLSDEDLVCVESPVMDKRMRCFTVLGNAGNTFGLGFFDTPDTYDLLCESEDPDLLVRRGLWLMTYGPQHQLPFVDEDLWHDHDLPLAADDVYPTIMRVGPDGHPLRPDMKQLTALEGLLRVLARTTEDHLDAGAWTLTVPTHAGPKTFTLSIWDDEPDDEADPSAPPDLLNPLDFEGLQRQLKAMLAEQGIEDLDQMKGFLNDHLVGKPLPQRAPETSQEKALDLSSEAYGAKGRKRLTLAKQALALDPDCVDAHLLLAEECGTAEEALVHIERAIAAGRRQLGAAFFRQNAGHFWGLIETRPFMRALLERAVLLEGLGRLDEAISDFRELLRLNPNDNQGAREPLTALLLLRGALDEAEALLKKHKADDSAYWHWARAILTFLQKGPGAGATRQARKAHGLNPHLASMLLGDRKIPLVPDYLTPGTPGEAAHISRMLKPAFDATPDARSWLRSVLTTP